MTSHGDHLANASKIQRIYISNGRTSEGSRASEAREGARRRAHASISRSVAPFDATFRSPPPPGSVVRRPSSKECVYVRAVDRGRSDFPIISRI